MARRQGAISKGLEQDQLAVFTELRIVPGGGDALALAVRLCHQFASSRLVKYRAAFPLSHLDGGGSVMAGTIFAATKSAVAFVSRHARLTRQGGVSRR